jgi:type I restriction enzyme S subunit
MAELNKLPNLWKWVKLQDIAKWGSGGTPTSTNSSFYGGNIPWLIIGDLNDGSINVSKKNITKLGLDNSSAKLVQPESVLIAMYGSIGKLGINKIPLATNQAIAFTEVLNENVINKYLFYYLFHIRSKLHSLGKGGTQKNISQSVLKQVDFPLPPFSEQQAIVSKIEELLSELENGKQQLQIAQQQLKVYRQSMLKWAFEGKLRNKKVKEGELPDGWKWVKIEDIATVGTGATPLKGNRKYYSDGKIAWVTSGALNIEFVKEASEYVTELALKETNISVYPKHTLLLAMYGEGKTRGKCSELLIEACTNQAIAAIHFENHDKRVKPFLKYFLLKNYSDIRRLSIGGVQPNLNLGIVKKTLFPFPPIEEQHFIVDELESKLTVCDKIEETIRKSLLQAETLRQSILKKAFEGKLL